MKPLYGTPLKRLHRDFRRQHPVEHEVSVILQSVEYPVNVGSIFRIADAVEVMELILTGITPTPPNPTIAKVARQKQESVAWSYAEEAAEPIAQLKQSGHRVYAVELTEDSRPYYEVDWPAQVALVVGHEDHGITRATLNLCDEAVHVPMWGKGLSLNVHVTLAVILFHIRYLELTRSPSPSRSVELG